MVSFRSLFEVMQCVQVLPFVFGNPALGDLVDGDRIEVVQLFTSPADCGNEVGVLQTPEVLRYRLTGHVQVLAKPAQCLAIMGPQRVQQAPSCRIGEGLEHFVHVHGL